MIPAIIPTTVSMMDVEFPKMKVLKCLWVMIDVDVGLLRLATLPQVITEVVDICILIPSTLHIVIAEGII